MTGLPAGQDAELGEAGSSAPVGSRRGAQVALALVWSSVLVLQTRAMLEWALRSMPADDGGAVRTILATVVAGAGVLAVVGVQRAKGGRGDLGAGALRFVSGVAWVVLVLVVVFVAWCALWALGDPQAVPGLLRVLAAVVPSVAALAVIRRLRTEPPGARATARVVSGLVGVATVPVVVAAVLVGALAAVAH
jgi:hypothetical protein